MRAIALLVVLSSFSGIASAQTAAQCPSTARAGDILNCYNGIVPPRPVAKPKTSKASTAPDKAAIKGSVAAEEPAVKITADKRAPYVDMLALENKKLDAKLKTLCRGC
jgi:hypothetical protein